MLLIKKIDDEESCVIAKDIISYCLLFSPSITSINLSMLEEYGHLIYLEAATIVEMKTQLESVANRENIIEFDTVKHEMEIELLITVGGDGTILWTVNYFQHRAMPPMFTIDRVDFEMEMIG